MLIGSRSLFIGVEQTQIRRRWCSRCGRRFRWIDRIRLRRTRRCVNSSWRSNVWRSLGRILAGNVLIGGNALCGALVDLRHRCLRRDGQQHKAGTCKDRTGTHFGTSMLKSGLQYTTCATRGCPLEQGMYALIHLLETTRGRTFSSNHLHENVLHIASRHASNRAESRISP